nr:g2-specific protein kinase fin1 [Quercus suber]
MSTQSPTARDLRARRRNRAREHASSQPAPRSRVPRAARQKHYSNISPTQVKIQIRNAWQKLSETQRDVYQTALTVLEQAISARLERKARYDENVAQVMELEAIQPMDWPKRTQLIDVLVPAVASLLRLQRVLVDAANTLRTLLLHMGTDYEVADHADSIVTAETAQLNAYQREEEAWVARQNFADVPEDHDANRRIKADWIHPKWLIEARRAWEGEENTLSAIPSEFATGGTWIGGWSPFPTGPATVAALYVEHNHDMVVFDRMVKKTEFLSMRAWVDMTNWDGHDLRDGATRKPAEVACQQAVQDIKSQVEVMGSVGIAQLRHWSLSNADQKYSVYTNYCPYKTLADLIHQYNAQDERKHIPEPVLWHFFRCMAEAGFAMQFGHTNWRDPTPVAGWKQIIHRDLKPRNIFLDANTPGNFDDYPTPRIGDFGNAFRTPPDDVMNPLIYRSGGTPGFIPPEQTAYIDPRTYQTVYDHKLAAYTNVYGIGLIMNCLMTLEAVPVQRDFLGDLNDTVNQDAPVRAKMVYPYSKALVDLVTFSVVANPHRRASFATILQTIDAITRENDEQHLHGMRTPYNVTLEVRRQQAISVVLRDEYAVGLSVDELPPRPAPTEEEAVSA